jgi:hypothetical protein
MFPRILGDAPVLFAAKYRYAEDYGLWCRLSALGRVVCPTQVVYRYRQHAASITSRCKAEQDACLAHIRYAYQCQYLTPGVPRDTVAEMARFWNQDGVGPLGAPLGHITPVLGDLRTRFLAYVERRFGISDRVALAAEIDRALGDRLAYWLYRSIRFRDGRACRALMSIAADRNEVAAVAGKTLARAARACARNLAWAKSARALQ